MKKNLFICIISFIIVFTNTSCGVGGAISPVGASACDARLKDYEAALTAWTGDVSNKTKCEAAKAATEKLINACTLYTVVQKKVYQDQLAQWKCD